MWELDYKESWVQKNWCFWTVVLEILENPLGCKKIQPVHHKGNQSWIFIGRTDGETETPILWPPDAKNRLTAKDPDAGKDWRHEEKGTTEDEMAGRHHRLNGHEFEQAPGVVDGQGGLVCYDSWGRKESETTERLTWLTDGAGSLTWALLSNVTTWVEFVILTMQSEPAPGLLTKRVSVLSGHFSGSCGENSLLNI